MTAVCVTLKTTEKLGIELYKMRSSRCVIKLSWQYWSNGNSLHLFLLIINL
jgi:hypothetical protein